MTTSELISYIKEEKELNNSTRVQLEGMIDKYPYFQTARLLLAKNLYTTDRDKFEDTLSTTAALCADRKRLFYLINSEKYKDFIKKIEPIDKSERTGEILDSYLTNFKINKDETIIQGEETIVSTDYIAYMQSVEEPQQITFDTETQNEFEHQDIIDSFLEKAETNEIGLQPLQKESKKTTVPDTETTGNSFLTETLAKIYIKQKKYEQALTIIQQLSLNFPKKSAYFADQIRFLEHLILNEKNKK